MPFKISGDFLVVVKHPDYKPDERKRDVPYPSGRSKSYVYLQPENGRHSTANGAPGASVLAPKAQRKLILGLKALQGISWTTLQTPNAAAAPRRATLTFSILVELLAIRRNDLPRARGSAHQGDTNDPKHARALAALGTVLSNQSKLCEEAISPLEKALK